MTVIRILGAATLAAMAWLFGAMIWRERKRRKLTLQPATNPASPLPDTQRNA